MKFKSSCQGGAAALAILSLTGACAVNPLASDNSFKMQTIAERDLLVDAARDVEAAPWPKPEPVSIIARITGGAEDDRVSHSDAVEIYVTALQPAGLRFERLSLDARDNLDAAARLSRIADNAIISPRVTMNDVVTVENAIQALREHRKIYTGAARQLEKLGEPVDEDQIDAIRTAYSASIRSLGNTADMLADRIEKDRTETIAARRAYNGG